MRRGHQGRTDENQTAIIDALRDEGASVQSLAACGAGCPDLVVGLAGQSFLVEVKNGLKVPSRRMLTDDQETWIKRWNGSAVVVLIDESKARSWARRIAAAPDYPRRTCLDGMMTFDLSATTIQDYHRCVGAAASPDCCPYSTNAPVMTPRRWTSKCGRGVGGTTRP